MWLEVNAPARMLLVLARRILTLLNVHIVPGTTLLATGCARYMQKQSASTEPTLSKSDADHW